MSRLRVLLARDAPVGVVIRRGPHNWSRLVHWDTATDTFTPGQWLNGRVDDAKSDLSPSGERLIYFASDYRSRRDGGNFRPRRDDDVGYTWTAVGRVPYFTAVALWPNASTTYFGGGLFASETELWLNAHDVAYFRLGPVRMAASLRPSKGAFPPTVSVRPFPLAYRDTGAFIDPEYVRLLRDGWTWYPDGRTPVYADLLTRKRKGSEWRSLPADLYRAGGAPERRPDRGWVLRFHREFQNRRYALRPAGAKDAEAIPLPDLSWADWDQKGRLVCARHGKLYALTPPGRGVPELRWQELADFVEMAPEPVAPPEWARAW